MRRDLHTSQVEAAITLKGETDAPPSPEQTDQGASPGLKSLNLRRMHLLLSTGKYAEALEACNAALALEPDGVPDPRYYAYRGASHLGLKDYTSADRDCSVAFNLDQALIQSLYWAASARLALNNHRGVIKATARILRVHPRHAPSWSLQCTAKRALGKWHSVLRDTASLLAISPTHGPAYCAKAEAHMHLGQLAPAESCAR